HNRSFSRLQGDPTRLCVQQQFEAMVLASAIQRLLRDDESLLDRGLALILDQRYGQESYRQLIPHHWPTCWLETGTQLEAATHAFWEQIESRDP
ncbi:MAG: hypothetical protein ACO3PR_10740, partial [Limisphaerales bacterium]